MPVAGIVLCGGESRRMGRPKAWLPWGDEFLLPRIVRLLGEAVAPVIVVAGPHQDLPPLPEDIPIVRDTVAGRGPLEGLAVGLRALACQVDAAYVSSCDVPLLRPAFVKRLIELLGDQAICVPEADGHRHPLAAVYRLTVLPTVERLLAENQSRLGMLLDLLPTRFVAAEELHAVDPQLLTLRNLNSPEEYRAALGG